MTSDNMKESLIALIRQEVKPALGCTEPVAVALAVARSCEELRSAGHEPERFDVAISANILKNGMGVGIPGTGMVGLDIAIALGSVCGRSIYGLEVLKDLDPEAVEKAKAIVARGMVHITRADDPDKLFVLSKVSGGGHCATATIRGCHDTIVGVTLDGVETHRSGSDGNCSGNEEEAQQVEAGLAHDITIRDIVDFVTTAPAEDLEFMMDSYRLNKALVEEGLKNKYGLQVGRMLLAEDNHIVYGDTLLTYAMACTAAASDARMAGCTLPAMSNSGSGNQGITVTVPVIAVAEKTGATHEQLIRALALAHLVAIHIKGHLGKLSALCGCVIASTGSSCGIVYLRGGGYRQICSAIKNMVGNITGMVCDGAKQGCALKVASGVACSMQSAVLALDGICISSHDGIIDDDIEKTIANLGRIGSKGMQTTDEMILDIMVCK